MYSGLHYKRRTLSLRNLIFLLISSERACPLSWRETSSLLYWVISKPAPCTIPIFQSCSLCKHFGTKTVKCRNKRLIKNCFLTISISYYYTMLASEKFTHECAIPFTTLINLSNTTRTKSIWFILYSIWSETIINRTLLFQQDFLAAGWGQLLVLTRHDLSGPRLN